MSKKLLLADDSVTIQKVVQLTFADEGIEVSTAGDGDMAMLKFAEISPDVVLADVHMPGKNGYEVCESIKQGGNSVPVVLLVGSFEPFDSDKAHQVGADAFLTKPFQSIRQLVDVVNNLLAADGQDTGNGTAAAVTDVEEDEDFVDTKEIPQEETLGALGDTGMDDDMIETMPAASLLAEPSSETDQVAGAQDEYAAPETIDEMSRETGSSLDDLPAYDPSGSDSEYETSEALDDYQGETLSNDSFTPEPATDHTRSESGFEIVPDGEPVPDEEPVAEPQEEPAADTSHGFAIVPETPAYTPPLSSYSPPPMDDSNLLEIPWSVGGGRAVQESAPPPVQESPSLEASPEFVEAVTERVMEKMNDDFFKNLVREIVPLVVREIKEESSGD